MRKALYLDADDTIWEVYPVGLASLCKPPYEKISDDAIKGKVEEELIFVGETDCIISLKEGARDLINWAKEIDMDVVLVSSNDPKPVLEAIKALDLDFDRTYIGWFKKSKIDVIKRDMDKYDIDESIFIDDNAVLEVLDYCKKNPKECVVDPVTNLPKPKDITIFDNIYDYIWEIYLEKVGLED